MSDRLPAFEKLTPEMQKALSDVTGAVNALKVSSVYPCRS
jgi:hypothetical protein